MFHIVLVSPEIPPNTGNVIRLSANTGCTLHLIKPLGFSLDDSHLRRAGLDYREYATLKTYESWDDFIEKEHPDPRDLYMFSSHATRSLPEVKFTAGSWRVFGRESAGLPLELQENHCLKENRIRIPMMPNNRSLNLSNSVAVAVFEAWRQHGYAGSV